MSSNPESLKAELARARELLRARDLDGAAQALKSLLSRHEVAEAAVMLGAVHAERGDFAGAVQQLENAFRLQVAQPAGVQALYARVLFQRARQVPLALSIEMLQRSVALDARNADAWNDLGNVLTSSALLAPARDAYRAALRVDPGYHQVESNLLIGLHYDPEVGAQEMFAAHRAWASRHAAAIAPLVLPVRPPSARLRIGLLSPAFVPGPTASYLTPLVKHLDRARYELFAYNVGPAQGIDAALIAAVPHWRHVAQHDDVMLAQLIAEDVLDVLVDLAGHTPGGRLLAVARKPARAVIEWLDYFDTSGLGNVDLLVTDPVSTPADSPQRFTEQLANIEPCRFCFEAPAQTPPVAPTPAMANGFVTFGSFNRLSKLAKPVIAAWARVLLQVPRSRLLVKNNALGDDATRENLARALQAHGIAPERFELRGPSEHGQLLAEYADMDIALDSFPYNGGLTTCEALWMGVPVLTVLGEAMISRQSASMLLAAGMGEWVAPDIDDFVRRAGEFSAQPAQLAASRALRREAVARSPLMDGPRFARQFAAILERAAR